VRPLSPPARLAAVLALALASGGACVPRAAADPSRQELRLHLALSSRPHGSTAEREALRDLQYEIAARLAAAQAGELVGDEWPDGWCVIRLAAPDALRALALAREPLEAYRPRAGSYAAVRRERGAPEERFPLAPAR
jgi:hypothetical protein